MKARVIGLLSLLVSLSKPAATPSSGYEALPTTTSFLWSADPNRQPPPLTSLYLSPRPFASALHHPLPAPNATRAPPSATPTHGNNSNLTKSK
ncbi:hypothetical protein FH972_012582 [Carpinus fangiana]|uniref:Uncharacterized protein n=1 Tax=Carpinus fangiana TaxID=176857 RepID=A0A5N6R458_9ROSI|nr:hypothetical protein FH972_012582 [Carpinus fangiana]